jgi:imidazoleglycerol-phosphate dehydratase
LLTVRLRIPGQGRVYVHTGEGFYDHMLQQLAFHGGMDLRLEGVGDPETGDHHTVEDMMRTFGEALDQAMGDRRGLTRYGEARVPMDEALAHAVVDLSGRATANISISPDPGMAAHAFESLAQTARITLHVTASGANAHHVAEASFKAVGRALAQALTRDGSLVRSTKGSL